MEIIMTKPLLLSALVAACAVLASPVFAEGMGMDNKSAMDKPAMGASDKMAKPDGMAKPASDKMEKPGAMMEKKDATSSDKMKK
jgi:predicted small secreted protein